MTGMTTNKAALPLLIQRIAISLFLGIWTLDKFVNPEHSSGLFAKFYGISLPGELTWVVGLLQLAVLVAFLLGAFKTWSYAIIFLMHGFSTLASWKIYLAFFDGNLLFWAAIPVLAAMWLQFALRDLDSYSLDDRLRSGILPD